MILANELFKTDKVPPSAFESLLILLSPFAPHITEELWEKLGHKESINLEKWPEYNPELAKEEEIEIVIQVNGKLRGKFTASPEITQEEALKKAKEDEKVKSYLEGKELIKEIYVPGKLVSFVIKG
ncbi:MAG TPA: hypothetical protein ENI70_00860 [Candidatus Peregrinibacteria bacterium]|nr:hypothetical protein [Candidatus Peregrinibacteria bacterium]